MPSLKCGHQLTHWGRVTHICVSNLTFISSDNGLSPGRRQAIIWTNAGILLIRPLEANFSEMPIKIHTFSFKKILLKTSSGKWRPFCLGLKVLRPLPWSWLFNIMSFTNHVSKWSADKHENRNKLIGWSELAGCNWLLLEISARPRPV